MGVTLTVIEQNNPTSARELFQQLDTLRIVFRLDLRVGRERGCASLGP